jgi:signal transduction histidine kinase/tetratricopeptide (TPR) repeat protein
MKKFVIIFFSLSLLALPIISEPLSYVDSLYKELDKFEKTDDHKIQDRILTDLFFYYENREVKKAIEIVKKNIEVNKKAGNDGRVYELYILLGTNYRKLGLRSLAMESYQKAMKITSKNEVNVAWSNISIGNFFFEVENYEKALNLYENALELFKKFAEKDSVMYIKGTSVALNNIGMCYDKMGDSSKVKDLFYKAFYLRKSFNILNEMSHSAMLIGAYFHSINNMDSALHYFDLGLDYGKKSQEKYFLVSIHLKKAKLYTDSRMFDKALQECTIAEELIAKNGEYRKLPELNLNYSNIHFQLGNYEKSLNYAEIGKNIAEENNDNLRKLNLLEQIISIYEAQGRMKDAYEHLWEYHKLSEELNNSRIEQIQYNFELKQSEDEIDLLNKNIEHIEKLSTFKITIATISSLALLVTLILLILIIRRNKKVRTLLENEKLITDRKVALADILKISVDGNIPYEDFFQRSLDIILNLKWLPVEDFGAIFVRNTNDEFVMLAQRNLTQSHHAHCQKIIPGECLCGGVINSNKPVIGTQHRSKFEDKEAELSYSHLKFPISLGDEVYGVLNLHQKRNTELSDIDMDLFRNVCWSLAGIIKNHHLTEKLEKRKLELDKLNQKLFANSLAVDQQNIEIKNMNDKLNIQKEELKKANATKNKFFNIIAHDLKNPFNSILGYSRLLQENLERFEKDQIKTFVEEILDSSETTYKLLENLLQWARAQQDKIPYKPEEIELYIIVYETVLLLKPQAKQKNIDVIEAIPKDILVFADVEMIKTAIRNLVSNAIKYTNKDGQITISAVKNNSEVVVSVADNGTGMSPKIQSSLFNIGDVKSKEGTEGETGTGFGLMISKEFVEKHGGSIWVESEEGKGSCFYFNVKAK